MFGAIRAQSGTGDTDFKFTREQLDSASATLELKRGNETLGLFEVTRIGVDEGFYFLAELAKGKGGSAQRIALFGRVAGVAGLVPSGIQCFLSA